jgi:hypothetical protein
MSDLFSQIVTWGHVAAGTVITNAVLQTYVIKRKPVSAFVLLLCVRGGVPLRFQADETIDHQAWRSGFGKQSDAVALSSNNGASSDSMRSHKKKWRPLMWLRRPS